VFNNNTAFYRRSLFENLVDQQFTGAPTPAPQQRSRSAQLERTPKSQVLTYQELAAANAKLFPKLERLAAPRETPRLPPFFPVQLP
jgi:hypothetical protein